MARIDENGHVIILRHLPTDAIGFSVPTSHDYLLNYLPDGFAADDTNFELHGDDHIWNPRTSRGEFIHDHHLVYIGTQERHQGSERVSEVEEEGLYRLIFETESQNEELESVFKLKNSSSESEDFEETARAEMGMFKLRDSSSEREVFQAIARDMFLSDVGKIKEKFKFKTSSSDDDEVTGKRVKSLKLRLRRLSL
jgi:hypothetical protein